MKPLSNGIRVEIPGKPDANSAIVAMPFVVALRPVSSDARVGEHSAVVWKFENRTPAVGDAAHVRGLDRAAEDVHGAVADVVPGDEQDVGRAVRCLRRQVRRPVGLRVADVELDLAVESA